MLSIEIDKTLVIAPTTSHHYGGLPINLCSILDLPMERIECSGIPEHLSCTTNITAVINSNKREDLCYNGSIINDLQKIKRFDTKVVTLRLKFTSEYMLASSKFHYALAQLSNISLHPSLMSVVHWRRGDQLNSRCRTKIDTSVNCGNASALIQAVKKNSHHTVVYVATNEPQDSAEMKVLRAQPGWYTFSDVVQGSSDPSLKDLDSLHILVAEAVLMLRADRFLAWGYSEVNNVVNAERKLMGRSLSS